jgi:hypothetical protein
MFIGWNGCDMVSLREEHALQVSEIIVLRKIFRPRKDELIEEWRKLKNNYCHFSLLLSSSCLHRFIGLIPLM